MINQRKENVNEKVFGFKAFSVFKIYYKLTLIDLTNQIREKCEKKTLVPSFIPLHSLVHCKKYFDVGCIDPDNSLCLQIYRLGFDKNRIIS